MARAVRRTGSVQVATAAQGRLRVQDDAVFARTVQLLYIQALLAGHHPLADADRALMTSALADLVSLSAGLEGDTIPFGDAR